MALPVESVWIGAQADVKFVIETKHPQQTPQELTK